MKQRKYLNSVFVITFFISFPIFLSAQDNGKKEYIFLNEPIDVVIPCAKKDLDTLNFCIQGIKENVKDLRRIIVVSSEPYTETAEWFNEKLFPFTKQDLGHEIFWNDPQQAEQFASNGRSGWIYQQFLKLYAAFVIPDISSNVLIVDADVVFYRPVTFTDEMSGAGLYNPGSEHHSPYFSHMRCLLPGLVRVFPQYSGISHHILFQKSVLIDLFTTVEIAHNMQFWQALCRCIDPKEIHSSCLSEYEIYFNFVFSQTDQVKIRHLHWGQSSNISQSARQADARSGVDYVAYQAWMR